MSDDLMRQVGTLQTAVDDIKKPEISRNVIAPFASLPGLIGLWYGGNYQRSTGDMPNLAPYISGASSQDLVLNGTRTNFSYDYLNNGTGYIDFPGTPGHFFNVGDNTDLDVQGNEGGIANPGLTVGCWVWPDVAGSGNNRGLVAKTSAVGQVTFYTLFNTNDQYQLIYSTDGTFNVGSFEAIGSPTSSINHDGWNCCIARWTPSTERSVFLNGTQTQTAASGFATIFDSTSYFSLGNILASNELDGRISVAFLCTSALNDATIQSLFQQTRSLYGV